MLVKIDLTLYSKKDEQEKLIDALILDRLRKLRDDQLAAATSIHDYLKKSNKINQLLEHAAHNLEFAALEKIQNESKKEASSS